MSETEGKASLTCLLAIAEAEASKLEAENDELRMDVDLMNCRLRACGEERDDLRAENAKLRKLVRGLNWCTESPDGPRVDCERCPLGVVDGEPLELMCEKMMRELGIEVDE